MPLISGLRWFEARHYARSVMAPVRRAAWTEQGRWTRKLSVSGRPGALWHREDVAGTQRQSRVCQAADMTEDDFLATDWMADVQGDPPPPPNPPPPPPQPPSSGTDCVASCALDQDWGGAGDAHFFINAGAISANASWWGSSIIWDDNTPDEDETLYVGSDVETGDKAEVWYAQKPFPPVPEGMVTTRLRLIDAGGEILYEADGDGWRVTRYGVEVELTLNEFTSEMVLIPISPLMPGPDNGAYRVGVMPREHGGLRFFDWTGMPQSPCQIRNIYGGLGGVCARLVQNSSPDFFNQLGTALTGPGVDGWGILLASFGMSRASLKAPYSGRRWTMSPLSWLQICNNLARIPRRTINLPWDVLMPPHGGGGTT